MALTKVTEVTLYAIASTASNSASVGAAVDVSTYYEADIRIRLGRGTGIAFTAAPVIRLQKTYKTSPTANDWVDEARYIPAVGASVASQALGGTEAVGQTTITLAAITNFAAGDFVFFQHSTIANSEWKRVLSASGSDIVVMDGLVFEQTAAASVCRDQAEEWTATMNLLSVQKIRIVVDGYGTGQAVVVEAGMGAVSAL